jgi:hypothetical protein
LIRCLCDEQGVSLLRPEDHDALAEKNGFVIKRLFALALQRNGLAKGDRERAEGNSGSDPSGS